MKSLQYLGFSEQQITALLWLGIAFAVILSAIIITLYLLNALALQKISKQEEKGVYWLGFIPIARAFLVSTLANPRRRWVGAAYVLMTALHALALVWGFTACVEAVNTVFPLAEAAVKGGITLLEEQLLPVISFINIVGAAIILAVIKKILYLICFNRILRELGIGSATAYTVLCVPFGFLAPIFLYSAARKEYGQ